MSILNSLMLFVNDTDNIMNAKLAFHNFAFENNLKPDLIKEVDSFISKSEKEVEDFRLKFLGKKGKMND